MYKDEAQLDKASPNKRKRDIKSDDGDDDADEDYEESPRKKKVIKREPAVKTPRTKKAVLVNDDSTESDEENLMEIKKKANKQVRGSRSFDLVNLVNLFLTLSLIGCSNNAEDTSSEESS